MFEIYGKNYSIDIDGITEKCRTGNTIKEEDGTETTEINIFKYEVIKMCLETILNEVNQTEDEMSVFTQKEISTAFKIAFNTLIKYEILIEENE
jgi:hypothetical protein